MTVGNLERPFTPRKEIRKESICKYEPLIIRVFDHLKRFRRADF